VGGAAKVGSPPDTHGGVRRYSALALAPGRRPFLFFGRGERPRGEAGDALGVGRGPYLCRFPAVVRHDAAVVVVVVRAAVEAAAERGPPQRVAARRRRPCGGGGDGGRGECVVVGVGVVPPPACRSMPLLPAGPRVGHFAQQATSYGVTHAGGGVRTWSSGSASSGSASSCEAGRRAVVRQDAAGVVVVVVVRGRTPSRSVAARTGTPQVYAGYRAATERGGFTAETWAEA
jgi:hypothetical protein